MARVVFLDRDGVINRDFVGDYVRRWKDYRFLPGVLRVLKSLTAAGFKIVIVSNQAGVGDGLYPQKVLREITRRMLSKIEKQGGKVYAVFYCTHGKKAGCACRKPKTGLFQKASRRLRFHRSSTFFVGDKLTDIEAGSNFGLRTILVLTGYGLREIKKISRRNQPDYIVRDLRRALPILLFNHS